MTNETLIAVPPDIGQPEVTRLFLLRLVERLDVLLGFRGNVADSYVPQAQLDSTISTASDNSLLFAEEIDALTGQIEAIQRALDALEQAGQSAAFSYSFNKLIGLSTQAVTSTLTAITWDSSADSVGDDVTFSGISPTKLTAVETGTYKVGGYAAVVSAAQRAQAALEIIIDGTPTGLQRSGSYIRNAGTAYDYWTLEVANTPFSLTAGQEVELGIGQVTGATYGYSGALTINCDRSKSEFWLERVR